MLFFNPLLRHFFRAQIYQKKPKKTNTIDHWKKKRLWHPWFWVDPHNKKICKTLGSPQKKSLKLPFSGRSCPGGIMFFFTFFFSSIFPMKGRDQEICQRKLIQYNSITLYNSKKQTSINIISTQTHLPTSNSLRAIPTFFAKHPRPSETMPFPSPGFATWTDSVMRTKSKTNPSGRDQTTCPPLVALPSPF